MGPRGRPFIDFTSTYTADYSGGGRGRKGRPTRSLSAAPTYRPSAGSIPTSGRPSTRAGGVSYIKLKFFIACLLGQALMSEHSMSFLQLLATD